MDDFAWACIALLVPLWFSLGLIDSGCIIYLTVFRPSVIWFECLGSSACSQSNMMLEVDLPDDPFDEGGDAGAAGAAEIDDVMAAFKLGVPPIAHVRLDVNADGRGRLTNLITKEVCLLPETGTAEYELASTREGEVVSYAVVSTDGAYKRALDDVFDVKLRLSDDGFVETVFEGKPTKLLPETFCVDSLYIPFAVQDGTRIRLKAYVVDWCSPSIFWEARRLWAFFNVSTDGMPKYVTQHFRNWNRFVSPYADGFLLLRAAHNPRSSLPQHYLRASDQAMVSTSGLLLLLGHRYVHGRPEKQRPQVPPLADKLVSPAFDGASYDISITLDSKYSPVIFSPLTSGDVEIPVDDGLADVDSLLAEDCPLQGAFTRALNHYRRHADASERIPIGSFMMIIYRMGYDSITVEVCSQLSNIVDAHTRRIGKKNPLDIPEDAASYRLKGRQDRVVMDKLVLGEGFG